MELFTKLFGAWLVFVYHCFDRIVLSGYLMGLQRPGQVVYWLQQVLGIEAITKEVLGIGAPGNTSRWVESYARNQRIPMEWAVKDVRKEDYVQPHLRRMERANRFGVYFIFQALEQGWTFRPGRQLVSRTPGGPADYPILYRHRSRYRYFYFYLRDWPSALGPMIVRMGTFIPFEASYYLNGHSYIERELRRRGVGFRKDDNAFVSVEDPGALQAAADGLSGEISHQKRLNYWTVLLGPKFSKQGPAERETGAELLRASGRVLSELRFQTRASHPEDLRTQLRTGIVEHDRGADLARLPGAVIATGSKAKLQTIMERIEHGQHVFRAYWKHAWIKQYEKYALRICAMKSLRIICGISSCGKGWLIWARCEPGYCRCSTGLPASKAENLNVHE